MRGAPLAAVALSLPGCVSVGAEDVLVPPMIGPDTEVVRVLGDGEPQTMTFADYLERHGGRAGIALGEAFDAGGAVGFEETLEAGGSSLRLTVRSEAESFGFAVAREAVPSPHGTVSALRVGRAGAEPGALFVHCGGSGSDLATTAALALVKTLPYGEGLAFDYPGYGDSGGDRTLADLDAAASAMATHLDAAGRPVVLWGHSFGGMVCAEIAGRMTAPSGVVMETSVADLPSAISYFAPWWARPFVRAEEALAAYDATASLARAGAPVLVLGAGRDRVLPPAASAALAERLEAAGLDVTYARAPEATHLDAWAEPEGRDAVRAFLVRIGVWSSGAD